eukprot:TRINITY_DN3610_c0_g1_i1.p1 TRINITY_DN3610_c0_g1~~TRINITY_DN3610_c0_g1_i1.p1  ORF type:complete len:1804 (+),score=440.38 TRINITY_DN3610_c0_g1_i1:774-5414(+)
MSATADENSPVTAISRRVRALCTLLLLECFQLEELPKYPSCDGYLLDKSMLAWMKDYSTNWRKLPSHGPLLLAWACVNETISRAENTESSSSSLCLEAMKLKAFPFLDDALRCLNTENDQADSDGYASVIKGLVHAILINFSPSVIPDVESLAQLYSSIFQGRPALCNIFWSEEFPNEYLCSLVKFSERFFPHSIGFIKLLTSLSAGKESSKFVVDYFNNLSILCGFTANSGVSTYIQNEKVILVTSDQVLVAPFPGVLITLPPGTRGSQRNDFISSFSSSSSASIVDAPVVHWETNGYSGWSLVANMLEQIANSSTAASPSHLIEASAFVESITTLISTICSNSPDLVKHIFKATNKTSRGLINLLSSLIVKNSNGSSLSTVALASCITCLKSLSLYQPVYFWTSLRQTGLLPTDRNNSPISSLFLSCEKPVGQYPITEAMVDLVHSLFKYFASRSFIGGESRANEESFMFSKSNVSMSSSSLNTSTVPKIESSYFMSSESVPAIEELGRVIHYIQTQLFCSFLSWNFSSPTDLFSISEKIFSMLSFVIKMSSQQECERPAVKALAAVGQQVASFASNDRSFIQSLLSILHIIPDSLNNPAVSPKDKEIIESSAYSMLTFLLSVFRTSNGKPSPLKNAVISQRNSSGNGTSSVISSLIDSHLKTSLCEKAVDVLAELCCVENGNRGISSLSASLGANAANILKNEMLTILKSHFSAFIPTKISILRFFQSVISYQPGLSELFFSQSNSEGAGKLKTVEVLNGMLVNCLKSGKIHNPTIAFEVLKVILSLWESPRQFYSATEAFRKNGLWKQFQIISESFSLSNSNTSFLGRSDILFSSLCFALCLRISAQECFILLKMSEMEKPFSQFLQKLPSIIKNVVIQIEFLDNLNKSSTAPQDLSNLMSKYLVELPLQFSGKERRLGGDFLYDLDLINSVVSAQIQMVSAEREIESLSEISATIGICSSLQKASGMLLSSLKDVIVVSVLKNSTIESLLVPMAIESSSLFCQFPPESFSFSFISEHLSTILLLLCKKINSLFGKKLIERSPLVRLSSLLATLCSDQMSRGILTQQSVVESTMVEDDDFSFSSSIFSLSCSSSLLGSFVLINHTLYNATNENSIPQTEEMSESNQLLSYGKLANVLLQIICNYSKIKSSGSFLSLSASALSSIILAPSNVSSVSRQSLNSFDIIPHITEIVRSNLQKSTNPKESEAFVHLLQSVIQLPDIYLSESTERFIVMLCDERLEFFSSRLMYPSYDEMEKRNPWNIVWCSLIELLSEITPVSSSRILERLKEFATIHSYLLLGTYFNYVPNDDPDTKFSQGLLDESRSLSTLFYQLYLRSPTWHIELKIQEPLRNLCINLVQREVRLLLDKLVVVGKEKEGKSSPCCVISSLRAALSLLRIMAAEMIEKSHQESRVNPLFTLKQIPDQSVQIPSLDVLQRCLRTIQPLLCKKSFECSGSENQMRSLLFISDHCVAILIAHLRFYEQVIPQSDRRSRHDISDTARELAQHCKQTAESVRGVCFNESCDACSPSEFYEKAFHQIAGLF